MSLSLCRITGTVVDHLGRARANLQVDIQGLDQPIVTSSAGVFGQSVVLRTDRNGSLTFDAIQGSTIGVAVQDRSEQYRQVYVPEEATADLFDLMFPYLESVALSLESTSLDVGEATTATAEGTLSDTRTLDVTDYVTLASSDEAVASVGDSSVTGVSAGSADISVSAVDTDRLASSPPDAFKSTFQDARGNPYQRQGAPEVTLPSAVTVTVS